MNRVGRFAAREARDVLLSEPFISQVPSLEFAVGARETAA
jgi:hypothetical protein